MKQNNNINIEIKNGVDKIYGIANLPEKDKKKANRKLNYGSRKALQADTFKGKLYNCMQTNRGHWFVRAILRKPLKLVFAEMHMKLPFKSDKRNWDAINEVIDASGIPLPGTMSYETWKELYDVTIPPEWEERKHHKEPKNLTSKPSYENLVESKLLGANEDASQYKSWTPIHYRGWVNYVHEYKAKIPSEIGQYTNQHIIHIDSDQYIKRLENHKMEKWVKRHPKPTDTQLKQDLFPELMNVEWNTREHNARMFIRNQLIGKYSKDMLPVFGRFEIEDGKYEERLLGYVKDKYHTISTINTDDNNPILRDAHIIFDHAVKHHPNLVSGLIQNKGKTIGRILIPKYYPTKHLQLKVSTFHNENTLKIAA